MSSFFNSSINTAIGYSDSSDGLSLAAIVLVYLVLQFLPKKIYFFLFLSSNGIMCCQFALKIFYLYICVCDVCISSPIRTRCLCCELENFPLFFLTVVVVVVDFLVVAVVVVFIVYVLF